MTSSSVSGSSIAGGSGGISFESVLGIIGAVATAVGGTVAAVKGTTAQQREQVGTVTGGGAAVATTFGSSLNPGASWTAAFGTMSPLLLIGGVVLIGAVLYLAVRK